ncbi:hypothetical protein ACEZCY_14560 [Streptacidiphilus sp. N1-12]|uniref:Uncharacterized protein n=2 Tax=Streptacidiphilus alkalitolerans TaxID=3342712 RepID=A0ABV6V9S9_9ACTN
MEITYARAVAVASTKWEASRERGDAEWTALSDDHRQTITAQALDWLNAAQENGLIASSEAVEDAAEPALAGNAHLVDLDDPNILVYLISSRGDGTASLVRAGNPGLDLEGAAYTLRTIAETWQPGQEQHIAMTRRWVAVNRRLDEVRAVLAAVVDGRLDVPALDLCETVTGILTQVDQSPAADLALYHAEFESLPLGLYTTREQARAHCQRDAESMNDMAAAGLFWSRDGDDDQKEELHRTTPVGHSLGTGFRVRTVTAHGRFDPNAEG